MKITLTGSLGHINLPLTKQLLAAGHEVTVITHSDKRVAQIETLGAKAAVGNIDDEAFMTKELTGADAAYLMIVGDPAHETDMYQDALDQANLYVRAIQKSGVKRVVDLSSVGANLGPEVGGLHIYNLIEGQLDQLTDVDITFIRPTGMFYNLLGTLGGIIQTGQLLTNADVNKRQSWIAPEDVAPVVAEALTAMPAGHHVQYVASDEKSYAEIAAMLGPAIGLPDLKAVQITDEQSIQGMLANGFTDEAAHQLTKMITYQRENTDFYDDYNANHPTLGLTKLKDYIPTLAAAYQQMTAKK